MLTVNYTGESCNQFCGTLQVLRETVQENSIRFECHDINGQIRSNSTRSQLARCLAEVIRIIQTGKFIIQVKIDVL